MPGLVLTRVPRPTQLHTTFMESQLGLEHKQNPGFIAVHFKKRRDSYAARCSAES